MRRGPRVCAVAVLAALCVASGLTAVSDARSASSPVHVTATFDRDAVLGSSTALDVALRLDPHRLTSAPLQEMRFSFPRTLGIVSSGLGLAACTPPAQDFVKVLLSAPGIAGCPPNSVMGYGRAVALVRLTTGQVIPEYATVTLLSGAIEQGTLELVVFIDGQRPFGAKLAFAGVVEGAGGPYGGALAVRMPSIPGLADVGTVSLLTLNITLGSHAIRYYERRRGRRVAYRPEGVALPSRCPRHGFQFRAELRFADGTRRSARSTTPCPPAVAAAAAGR